MYVIKKYSASGLYSGEPIESFETREESAAYLNTLAEKYHAKGYDIDESFDKETDLIDWLELTHDDLADAISYRVVYEPDNSPKYFCTACGDEDFSSEFDLDEHIYENHVDSEDEAS